MDFFKKRKNAVTIFIIVVIVFTLLGCHRSLSKKCREAEEAFFDKTPLVSYGAYTAPADHLENCVRLANRLLSVIGGSEEFTNGYSAVLSARQLLSDALASGDISDIYDANQLLVLAVSAVDAQVQLGAKLPESNDDYYAIISDFNEAQRVVSESPYNDYVDDFIRTNVKPFPTGLLRVLSFTRLPEKFE